MNKYLQHKKNVYSLDGHYVSEFYDKFVAENLLLYYSTIKKEFDYKINLGKLFYIDVPVVGIFVTSKQQGKFTVQLLLRKYLTEMGYRVGQIGTEPQSMLFGFNNTIPVASAVKFLCQEVYEYIGFLFYVRLDTSNHVLCYIKQDGYYYIFDPSACIWLHTRYCEGDRKHG